MLALCIVSGIVIIIAILPLCPVCLTWKYEEELSVTAKYLFFNFMLLPAKQKQEKADKPKQKNGFLKDYCEKHGFSKTVSQIFEILKAVVSRFVWLFKRFKFKDVYLDITVASENAAYTAVEYGAVCAAVYPAMSLISTVATANIKRLNVSANFDSDKWNITTSGVLKCRLIWLLTALISLVLALVKSEIININLQKREGANNERQ